MGAVLPEAAYDKCGLSDAAEPPEHRNVAVPESFPNPGRGGGRRGAHANGFIYDSQNRLACDYCAASGNVRRQKCPFGYCQAVAACPKCKKTHAVDFTPAKHREMGCEREMKEVREDNRRLREGLAQGRLLRVSAFMSSTQPGMVDVIFQDAHRRDTVRVFPKALYDSFSLTKAVFLDEFEAAARGGTVPGASAGGAESATRAAPRGVPRTVDSRGQGGWSFNPPRTSAPPFVMPPMPDRRDVERLRREYPGRYEQIEALERRLHATSKGTPTYPNGPPPGLVPGQSYDDGRPDPLRGQRVIGDDFRGEVRARALGCDAKTPAHVVGGVIVPRTRIVAAIRAQHRVPQSVRIGAPDPAPEEPAPGPRPIPPPPPPPPVQAAPPRPRTPLVVRDAGFPARLLRVVIPFDDNWTSADPESFRYAVRPEGDPVELPWEDARDAHGRDILAFGPAIPTPRGPLFVTGSLIEELRRIAIPFRVLVEEFDVTDQFDFVATTAPESEDGPSAFTLVPYEAGYVPPELEYLGASAPRFRVAAFLKVNANWQTHRYAQFSETPVRFEEVRQWAQGKRPKRVRIEDIEPVRLHPASVPAQLLQLVLDRAHGGHAHADGLRALFRALTPSGARVNLDWSRDDGEHMLGPRLTLKGKAAEELGHELLVTSDLAAQLRRVGEAFGIPVEVRDVTNQYHLFATTAGAEYDHGSTFTVLPFGAGYLPPELQDLGARVPGYREKYVYRVIAVRPEDAKWQTERNRSGGHPSWPTTLPDVAAWAAAPRTPAAPPAARALATAEAVESTVARLRAELAASAEGARLEFPEDADSFGGPEPVRASQILAGVTPDGIESLVRQGREEEALALVRGVEQRLDAARSSAPLNVTAADVAPEGAFDAFLGGRPPVPVAPAEASATWAAARARTLRVLDAQLADAEASWREADAQVKRFLAKRDGKGMDRWEKVRNLHGERKLGLDRALAILNDTRDTRLSWPEAESAVASILRKLPPEPDSRRAPARPSVSMLPRAELASLASRRLAEARADADKLKRAMPRHFRSDRERDEWMQKDKISRERVTACETALEIASDAAVRDADADARVSDLWHRFPRAK